MQFAVIAVGFLAQFAGWRLVAKGRHAVWNLMVPVVGLSGVAAVIARPPVLSGRESASIALAVGAGTGAVLYAATLVFVAIAARWEPFRAHVVERYDRVREIPLWMALGLSVAISVPAEELFWRGLAQPRLQASMPTLTGPALAWAGYVAATTPSGSLPLIAGTVVGGAVWAALALWTKGVLASIACHAIWSAAMLTRPPRAGAAA